MDESVIRTRQREQPDQTRCSTAGDPARTFVLMYNAQLMQLPHGTGLRFPPHRQPAAPEVPTPQERYA